MADGSNTSAVAIYKANTPNLTLRAWNTAKEKKDSSVFRSFRCDVANIQYVAPVISLGALPGILVGVIPRRFD